MIGSSDRPHLCVLRLALAALLAILVSDCSTPKTKWPPEKPPGKQPAISKAPEISKEFESNPELDFYEKVLVRYRDCVLANATADRTEELTPAQIVQQADAACKEQFGILQDATEKYIVGRAPPEKAKMATAAAEHHARQVRGRVLRKAELAVQEARGQKPL